MLAENRGLSPIVPTEFGSEFIEVMQVELIILLGVETDSARNYMRERIAG